MKIFLDTANIEEIKKGIDLGICDGVTTNPSWIARDSRGKTFEDVVKEICYIVKGPVSAEVVAIDKEGMIKEAREISKWADNIVVKIPCIENGLKAVKILSKEDIKTNVTLVNSAIQSLLAAKVGATFVSPFMGRLYDAGYDGLQIVKDSVEIFNKYKFETQILAASFREAREIVDVAKIGCPLATIKPEFIDKVLKNPFTSAGLKKFLDDWKNVKK